MITFCIGVAFILATLYYHSRVLDCQNKINQIVYDRLDEQAMRIEMLEERLAELERERVLDN